MWINFLLVLTVTSWFAEGNEVAKDDGVLFDLQTWARDLQDPEISSLLRQEGPQDRKCFTCLSTSLSGCGMALSLSTCGANFTCYTLDAFNVAENRFIYAKGCFPDFLCRSNQGCIVLNESRNGVIGSCSFSCCYTDQCNGEPNISTTSAVPSTATSVPTTDGQPTPQSEPTSVTTTDGQPTPQSEPTSVTTTDGQPTPQSEPTSVTTTDGQPTPQSEPTSVTTTDGQPTPQSEPTSPTTEPSPTTAETTPAPTTPPGCGGPFMGPEGNFTSPGFHGPDRPTHSISCTWTITVPQGSVLVLNFLKIKLEKCCDSLEVKIGGRLVRKIMGYWNGKKGGRYVRSPTWSNYWYSYWNKHWSQKAIKLEVNGTGEEITINFFSNRPVTKSGFFASYKVVTPIVCGGPLRGSYGNFTSPGYPGNYPDNASCTWTMTVPQGSCFKLRFQTFDTERCCDYVKIIVGNREVRRLAGSSYSRRRYGYYYNYWRRHNYGRRKRSNDIDGNWKRTWGYWRRYGHQTGNNYGGRPASYYYRHGKALQVLIRGSGKQISIIFISDYSITKKGFSASYSVIQGCRYFGYYGDNAEDAEGKERDFGDE